LISIIRLFSIGALASILSATAFSSGIFTLRGKLKSFSESTYEIQTKTMVYEIKKSGLSEAQVAEMKTKKTGQEVELVVATEAVAKVRDVAK
jgi:hypothetical protein